MDYPHHGTMRSTLLLLFLSPPVMRIFFRMGVCSAVCRGTAQPKGGGGGWVWSQLAPKVETHGQCARTSPARLGTPLWLSGLTAVQIADDPRAPPGRWWEGDAAVPVCPRALGPAGGGGGALKAGGTPLSFSSGPWLARVADPYTALHGPIYGTNLLPPYLQVWEGGYGGGWGDPIIKVTNISVASIEN